MIEGTAQPIPRAEDLLFRTTRLAARYMGSELAVSYGKRNAVEGEYLVQVVPGKIIAKKGIAD